MSALTDLREQMRQAMEAFQGHVIVGVPLDTATLDELEAHIFRADALMKEYQQACAAFSREAAVRLDNGTLIERRPRKPRRKRP